MILLVMVMLTALDHQPVWVESTHIEMMRSPFGNHCQYAGTIIRLQGHFVCVLERPEEVADKVRRAQ